MKKIYKLIVKLEIGKKTKAIQVGNNFLIVKVEDIKESIIKINTDKELKKITNYEQNRQLDQFSKIYFNKVKLNTNISEL